MRALALWGGSYVVGGLGSALLALRYHIPDIVSIGLGNTLVIAAFGLSWSGYRSFEGREPGFRFILVGCLA